MCSSDLPAANLYAETCFTLMKITDEGGKPLARKPLRNRKCRADHSDGHSPLSCIRSGGGVTPPVLTHEKGGKGGKGGKCVGLCEPFLSCAHKKTFRLAAGARPAGRQDVGLRPSLRPRFGLDCGLRPTLFAGILHRKKFAPRPFFKLLQNSLGAIIPRCNDSSVQNSANLEYLKKTRHPKPIRKRSPARATAESCCRVLWVQ